MSPTPHPPIPTRRSSIIPAGGFAPLLDRLDRQWDSIRAALSRWRPFWWAGGPHRERDERWWDVRAAHLKLRPQCEACGAWRVQVHHVLPVHLRPDLELDPLNLFTLCKSCHKALGHGGDWWAWVPDVRELAAQARSDPRGPFQAKRAAIASRRYAA